MLKRFSFIASMLVMSFIAMVGVSITPVAAYDLDAVNDEVTPGTPDQAESYDFNLISLPDIKPDIVPESGQAFSTLIDQDEESILLLMGGDVFSVRRG